MHHFWPEEWVGLVGKTSEKHLCRQRIIIMTLLVGKSRGLLDPAVATAKATAALAELDLRSKIARGGKNFPNFFFVTFVVFRLSL